MAGARIRRARYAGASSTCCSLAPPQEWIEGDLDIELTIIAVRPRHRGDGQALQGAVPAILPGFTEANQTCEPGWRVEFSQNQSREKQDAIQ